MDGPTLLRDFVPWLRTRGRSALVDAQPWMTFEAGRILMLTLPGDAKVLEFGSGGSTLFLAPRVGALTSVEHDPRWFDEVRSAVAGLPTVELLLREPRLATTEAEAGVVSSNPAYAGKSFAEYVAVADRFPDGHLDVLIVDGRARVQAFLRAARKVRSGGLIILDDSEREEYRSIVSAAREAGWPERGRYGPKPFTPWFARTTVWVKTGDLPAASG